MSGVRIPSALEYLVDWLRALSARAQGEAMADVAEAVGSTARRQYASGTGPAGQVWPRRKKDGALALQRPAGAVVFEGRRAAVRGRGEDVLEHHRRKRPVFPSQRQLPDEWLRPAEEALRKALEKGAPK